MKNRKRYINLFVLFVICAIVSVIYYTQLIHMQVRLHSDDAGTATLFYNAIMGKPLKEIIPIYSPFAVLRYVIFLIFGFNEEFVQIKFTVEFFLCLFPALYLATNYQGKWNWSALPLFLYFMAIPGHDMEIATKFHVVPTITLLLILIIFKYFEENKRKISFWGYVLIGMALYLSLVEKDLICVIAVVCPLLIYKLYNVIKNGKYERIYAILITFFLMLFSVLYFFLPSFSYTGWGAKYFSRPEDILYNINLGIEGVLSMFNIPMIGKNIIQLNTIIYLIKLMLLLISFGLVLKNIICFFKGKAEDTLNVLISLSVMCSGIAYIFSGKQINTISVRYMQSLVFLLPLLVCREALKKQFLEQRKWYLLGRINVISLACLFFLFMATYPISFEKEKIEEVDEIVEIIESDGDIHNGIADFWRADVISVLSEGNSMVESVRFSPDMDIYEPYWGEDTEHEHFREGHEYYNMCIGDTENDKVIIKELYGDPIKTYEVGDTVIYIYDYDIRWVPIVVQENMDFSKQKDYHIAVSMPLGKTRITFEGKGLQDMKLSTNGEREITVVENSDTKVVYELSLDQNTDMELEVKTYNKEAIVEQMSYCVVNAYKDVYTVENGEPKNSVSFYIPQGKYYIYLEGENIKKEEYNLTTEQDENIIEEIQKGKIQQRMKVDVEQDTIISIMGDSMDKIKRVSYTGSYKNIPEKLIVVGDVK